jgi:hypothetical protein
MDAHYEYDYEDSPSPRRSSSSKQKLPVEETLNVSTVLDYTLLNFQLTLLQKRRDQNRVSQRAFRQRKEKHTKELEQKVEELETLLETASQENSIAASQMSRMEQELSYYRRLLFSDTQKLSGSLGLDSPVRDSYSSSSYPSNPDFSSTGWTAGLGTGGIGGKPLPYLAGYTPSPFAYTGTGSAYSTSSSTRDQTPDSPQSYGRTLSNPSTSPLLQNLDVQQWQYGTSPETPAYVAFNTSEPAQGFGNQWGVEDRW